MSWPKVRLGDVCEINLGKTPPRGVARMWDETHSKGCVWSSIADMANLEGGYLIDTKEYVSKAAVEECDIPVVKKGTLLVSFKLTLGRTAIAGRDLYTNEAIAALPFRDAYAGKVDVDYLRTYFTFFDWDEFARKDEKVLGKTLNKKKLAVLPVVLPPLAEQKKIVEKVEKALKRVDALKAQFERMEKSAADYFKAALAETFAAVKGEKVKLGDVCDVRDGTHDSPRPSLNGYPLVTSKNIKGGILSLEKTYLISEADYEAINKRSKVDVYDVLFSMIGTVGEVAVIREEPRFAIKNVGLIKTKGDAGLADFLFYYLKSEPCRRSFENQLKGSNQKFLALGLLREIEIPKDCLDRARQISSDLDAAKAKSERMVAAARRGIEICGKMRKAILAEAFQ